MSALHSPKSAFSSYLPRSWLASLWPAPLAVDARERTRVVVGSALGMLLTALLGYWASRSAGLGAVWLVAPLGASTVLVFGVPASPLAQPWSVVGGNTFSALVGIACLQLIGNPLWAAPLAVAGAIALMFALRCLHPPGGAAALLVVMAGVTDWHFAFYPVLLNSIVLVAAGMVYNSITGRRYPHVVLPAAPQPAQPLNGPRFSEADLDAVLARYNQVLDVPRDDLRALMEAAELQAYQRRFVQVRCADIMSTDVKTAEFGTPLKDAWTLLREHRIKALPVVDRARRVIGIVTLADFMRAAVVDEHASLAEKLRSLLRPSPSSHSSKAEVVGQIMTRQVRVASAERSLAELIPMFADMGHHHIPIVGAEARLVGILTQSDMVKTLRQA